MKSVRHCLTSATWSIGAAEVARIAVDGIFDTASKSAIAEVKRALARALPKDLSARSTRTSKSASTITALLGALSKETHCVSCSRMYLFCSPIVWGGGGCLGLPRKKSVRKPIGAIPNRDYNP